MIEFTKLSWGALEGRVKCTEVMIYQDGETYINGDEFSREDLEQILAKMKELQSPNKDIEFLQADIASLVHLLDMSIESNDPVGKIQLSSRLETRKRELKELQSEVKK